MRKILKIGAVAVGAILALLAVFAILAKVLITPERVRAAVLPLAEQSLGREVELGAIEVGLFSGIVLHDFVIREKSGPEHFVSSDQAVLRYNLWPLLRLRVVVDEIRLEQPRIRVVRLPDGSFNFTDLLGDPEESGAVPQQPAEPGARSPATPPPLDLTIATVRLTGGNLLFIDEMADPNGPMHHQVGELNFSASDIALGRPFPFELTCLLNEAPLLVAGRADILRQTGQARVTLRDFDPIPLSPYFHDLVPGRLGSLKIDLDLLLEGGLDQLTSRGQVTLREIDLDLETMGDAPVRGASLLLDYDATADLQAETIELRRGRAAFNGIVAELVGSVADYGATPVVALDFKVPPLELRRALAGLPGGLVPDLATLDPAGIVEISARLEGPVDEPTGLLKRGWLRLQEVQATSSGLRPSLTGLLNLNSDQLSSQELVLRLDDNLARIDLQARNLFGDIIVINNDITAERFDLDLLLQAAAAPAAGSPAPEAGAELGPFAIPLVVDGTVRVGQTIYQGLAIEDFDLVYRLAENILTVEKMSGKMAGGTFANSVRVDLTREGLAYQARVNLQSVQAEPMVEAFWPAGRDGFFGKLDLAFELNGRGTEAETLKKNLNGQGSMHLTEGKITGAGLSRGLADFLGLEELRILRFSKLAGSFTVAQGRVQLNTDLAGSTVRMQPRGSIGLDGSLDLALNTSLAPSLMDKLDHRGQVTSLLRDQEGWGQLPLKVAGSYERPNFALDTTQVRKQVQEQVKEQVVEELQQRVIDKILPPEKEGEKGEREPGRKLLDEAVRGLFGR